MLTRRRTHTSLIDVLGWLVAVSMMASCGGGGESNQPDRCKDSICGPSSGGTNGGVGAGGGTGGRGGAASGGSSGAAAGGQGGTNGGGGGDAASGGAPGGSGGKGGSGSGGDGAGGAGNQPGTGGSATGGDGGTAGDSGSSGSGGSSAGASGGSAGMPPCQGDDCGPIAELDMEFYKCNVEPIFDRSCAMLGCHGDEARPFRIYARGRLRNDQDLTTAQNPAASGCLRSSTVNLNENGTGTVMCEGWTRHTDDEWQKNFDSSSSFMRVNMNPEDSELLTQPTVGGLPHVNVHPFVRDDASYTMILRWLSGETLGSPCNPEYN